MPWQDVAAKYEGQIAVDAGMYFLHRWTFGLLQAGFKSKQSKMAWITPPLSVCEAVPSVPATLALEGDSPRTTAQLLRSFPAWAGCNAPERHERSIYSTMVEQIAGAKKFICARLGADRFLLLSSPPRRH